MVKFLCRVILTKLRPVKKNDEYEDFLMILNFIKASLRSGMPFAAVLEQIKVSPKYRRLFVELGLGSLLSLGMKQATEDSFYSRERLLAHNHGNLEFISDFSTCLIYSMKFGGNIDAVIEHFVKIVKSTQQARKQFAVSTAQMRFQAQILCYSPFILALLFLIADPERIFVFFRSGVGFFCIGIMILLYCIGVKWIRVITSMPEGM